MCCCPDGTGTWPAPRVPRRTPSRGDVGEANGGVDEVYRSCQWPCSADQTRPAPPGVSRCAKRNPIAITAAAPTANIKRDRMTCWRRRRSLFSRSSAERCLRASRLVDIRYLVAPSPSIIRLQSAYPCAATSGNAPPMLPRTKCALRISRRIRDTSLQRAWRSPGN